MLWSRHLGLFKVRRIFIERISLRLGFSFLGVSDTGWIGVFLAFGFCILFESNRYLTVIYGLLFINFDRSFNLDSWSRWFMKDFHRWLLSLGSLLGALVVRFRKICFLLLLLFLLFLIFFQLFVLLSCQPFCLLFGHFHPYWPFFFKVLFVAVLNQGFINVHGWLFLAGINDLKSSQIVLFILLSVFLMFGNHLLSFLTFKYVSFSSQESGLIIFHAHIVKFSLFC